MFYFAEALVLARHLKAQGVTHLHNHFGNSSCSVAMLASRRLGDSLQLHDARARDLLRGAASGGSTRRSRARRFVACISHFCRSQGMIFADPAHWEKMRIVHCGVDPARYDSGPREAPGKRLLFVGRLAAVKGVLVLLAAFAEVLKAHPDAQLTLVGDGAERPKIEALARELGLGDAVRFAGYLSQDEVADELARADLFVLPSFAEGVPVVLMEAMAAPPARGRDAHRRHSRAGRGGRLGPARAAGRRPASLGRALAELLGDPERRRRMGEAGRAKVVERVRPRPRSREAAPSFSGSKGQLTLGIDGSGAFTFSRFDHVSGQ